MYTRLSDSHFIKHIECLAFKQLTRSTVNIVQEFRGEIITSYNVVLGTTCTIL